MLVSESAVAGLAALLLAMQEPYARGALGLGPDSRVLLFGTRADGLWRSDDAGASWREVQGFPAIAKDRSAWAKGWRELRPVGIAFVATFALKFALAWLGMGATERPGGIVLRGPAGIGKTAFCRELAALARERGWTVAPVDAAQPGRAYAVIAALTERLVASDRALLDHIGAAGRASAGAAIIGAAACMT